MFKNPDSSITRRGLHRLHSVQESGFIHNTKEITTDYSVFKNPDSSITRRGLHRLHSVQESGFIRNTRKITTDYTVFKNPDSSITRERLHRLHSVEESGSISSTRNYLAGSKYNHWFVPKIVLQIYSRIIKNKTEIGF